MIAALRIRQLLGGEHQAVYDYYQRRLFAPLSIRHGVIEPDASGTPAGGARGVLRPVDWLRLGQLIANGGRWNDARKQLPEDLVGFAGHLGQLTVIVPSRRLVVVRMGVAMAGESARNDVFALVTDLAPAARPMSVGPN